ncbi:MAG TPA: hypothetical protein VGT41_01530 [Candidatus Babeliales bacterium]|nr:hypothetical protein [Candidatus Babeliales bacterium]
MLLGIKNIESIIGLLLLTFVYLISITPAGCFRAWVGKKMGDDTAEEFGFLTLNPFAHINLFGLLILFLSFDTRIILWRDMRIPIYTGFGWGQIIPLNPVNIGGRHRFLKLAAVLFSNSFIFFCIPILALLFFKLVLLFTSPDVIGLTPSMLLATQLYRACMSLNVWLLLVESMISAVVLMVFYYDRELADRAYYVIVFAPIVILVIFGGILSFYVEQAITYVGNLIL